MATKTDRQRSEQLTKATAEKVLGWKAVHKHNGELIGKKRDKAGRWRKAKVPNYAHDQRQAYAIDERMKALGRWSRYQKALAMITKRKNLPAEWATPEQRCHAALRAVGDPSRLKMQRTGKHDDRGYYDSGDVSSRSQVCRVA